jgi:hypothetical protein
MPPWCSSGLVALCLFGHVGLYAQISASQRERLMAGEVVMDGGMAYAMASGVLRGSLETTKELLATRAMGRLANRLCGFDPRSGVSLDASMDGLTWASVEVRGAEVVVIMKAPVQTPLCKVSPSPSKVRWARSSNRLLWTTKPILL